MNQYNAARAAGYSETYAKQACRTEKLVKVSLSDAFEQAGLTDNKIIQHALEGLQATKSVKTLDGKVLGDAPEWTVRHKYFETILKMTDRLREKMEVNLNKTEKFIIIRYDQSQVEEVSR